MMVPGTGVVTPPSRRPAAATRVPGANLPPIVVEFRRAHVWALGGLSVAAVILGWLGRQRELLVGGDEPFYLTLSYSLAAGRYHDEFLVGAPPHVQYPPGMPTLLLLLRSLFGPDPDVARAVNLLFVVLTMLLMADLVRRISTPLAGVITAALVGLNPFILMRAGTLYAETLLMVAMAAAVWAATMADARPARWWPLLAVAAGAVGFLARVPGLAILAGLMAGWGVQRRWRSVVLAGVATVATVPAWFYHVATAETGRTIARSYAGDLAFLEGRSWVAEILRLLGNARIYMVQELPHAMVIPTVPGTPIDNLLVVTLLSVLGLVGILTLVRSAPVVAGVLCAYGAIIIYWPWANERFLSPALPIIFAVLVTGADRIGRRAGGLRGAQFAPMVLTLTLLPTAHMAIRAADLQRRCEPARESTPLACYPERDRGFVTASELARASLPTNARVLVESPAYFHYLSGKQGFPFGIIGTVAGGEDLLRLVDQGLTHVLLGPARDAPGPWRLTQASLAACERLSLVAEFPGALLLEIVPLSASRANACNAVTTYRTELEWLRQRNR